MDKVECTTTARDALRSWRLHHPHPRVQRKMEALSLKSQGLAPADLCRLCSIAQPTFSRSLHTYHDGGIAALKEGPLYRRQSPWAAYRPSMEADLRQRPQPVWPRRPRGLPT